MRFAIRRSIIEFDSPCFLLSLNSGIDKGYWFGQIVYSLTLTPIPMKSTIIFFAFCLMATMGWSQMQAKKVENPRWKQIVYIDFHDGKYDRAITIIKDYFEKAGKKANLPGPETMMRMSSGSWDLMLICNMKGRVEH